MALVAFVRAVHDGWKNGGLEKSRTNDSFAKVQFALNL